MKEILKLCKFFKGEDTNPFDWATKGNENQFWEYEKIFVNKYELGIEFKGIDPKKAFDKYLQDLFILLADKYETDVDHFMKIYNV